VKTLRATREGTIDGVSVVGFHGRLHSKATPARRGPVFADDERHLLRIVEVHRDEEGASVVIETAGSPLPEAGDLPGDGTRVSPPWPARLDHVVVVLGPAEIERADALQPASVLREPVAVQRFVDWLREDGATGGDLDCQRIGGGAAWYCSKTDGHALFQRVHGLVVGDLYRAAQLLVEKRPGARVKLEEASWWLSRAVLDDGDIYLAAAGLERAGSPAWLPMLRKGLRDARDDERLEGARRLLLQPPVEESAVRSTEKLADRHASIKQLFRTIPPKKAAG
jgi:hypothetical protein